MSEYAADRLHDAVLEVAGREPDLCYVVSAEAIRDVYRLVNREDTAAAKEELSRWITALPTLADVQGRAPKTRRLPREQRHALIRANLDREWRSIPELVKAPGLTRDIVIRTVNELARAGEVEQRKPERGGQPQRVRLAA